MKLAIIGCGNMGLGHARRIETLGHSVAAACDAFPGARDEFKAKYPKTQIFDDHRTLLEKARPDAVWICLPTFLHKQTVLDCAAAKVHAMIEKPMALTEADCREMDSAMRAAKAKLMIAFCRRFDTYWGKLREVLVERRALGKPVVWRHIACGRPPRDWFLQKDKGGGPFMDGCVHNWDFCLWTFGAAKSVKASLLTLSEHDALDTGVADVIFESGDRTTLNWCWGVPAGARGANDQDILGRSGVLRFSLPDEHKPKGFNAETMGGFHISRGKDQVEVFTYEKNDMYVEEDRHFLECIAQDREPICGGAAGIAATALAERVFKASAAPGI